MPVATVLQPGLQTTVQDLGRWGSQAYGVPVAGAMDPRALRIANALVGNVATAAGLEVAFSGPRLQFDDERVVAVAGADFELSVDGQPVGMSRPVVVRCGSCLAFGRRRRGARAYLSVAGGIAVPVVLGSRATHVASRMGGLAGRAVAAGDRLPLGDTHVDPPSRLPVWPLASDFFSPPGRLRVLPDPQHESFAHDALALLQSAPFVVSTLSDRMGFRLTGPRLEPRAGDDFISDPTPLGALQVPPSGQPVLLMADRQTTGGYPKLATVITADVHRAAQLSPGDAVSFEVCTHEEAMAALIAGERAVMAFEASG